VHVLAALGARLQADVPLRETLLSLCTARLPYWQVEAGGGTRPFAALGRSPASRRTTLCAPLRVNNQNMSAHLAREDDRESS
jgi:hypothetical protein